MCRATNEHTKVSQHLRYSWLVIRGPSAGHPPRTIKSSFIIFFSRFFHLVQAALTAMVDVCWHAHVDVHACWRARGGLAPWPDVRPPLLWRSTAIVGRGHGALLPGEELAPQPASAPLHRFACCPSWPPGLQATAHGCLCSWMAVAVAAAGQGSHARTPRHCERAAVLQVEAPCRPCANASTVRRALYVCILRSNEGKGSRVCQPSNMTCACGCRLLPRQPLRAPAKRINGSNFQACMREHAGTINCQ